MPRYPLRAHLFLPGARIHPRSTQTTRNNTTQANRPPCVFLVLHLPTYLPTYQPTRRQPTASLSPPNPPRLAVLLFVCVRSPRDLVHRLASTACPPLAPSHRLGLLSSLSSFHRFFFLPLAPCLARVSPLATPIARDHAALARSLARSPPSSPPTRATQLYSPIYRC